jgi:hypothetical protein
MEITSTTKEKITRVEYLIKGVEGYGEVIYADLYNENGKIFDCDLRTVFGNNLLIEGEWGVEQLLEDIQDLVGGFNPESLELSK